MSSDSKHVEATCAADEHRASGDALLQIEDCQRAAAMFSALGDSNRLRLLGLLIRREMCVTEIATILDDNLPAVSQRLKLLRNERIVNYRRDGKHVYYRLDDEHIVALIRNALDHAGHE
ncbi:MAG: metalloregulator ArsR/SmtB family transcription factor [Pirellulales bacterium]|nr:metalloregulator ArsR/SmtB family transcription factor [Pirellulales bacterium]